MLMLHGVTGLTLSPVDATLLHQLFGLSGYLEKMLVYFLLLFLDLVKLSICLVLSVEGHTPVDLDSICLCSCISSK